MADPVRSDESLSSMRFPETPSSPGSTRTGPQAVTSAESFNEPYALPEHTTVKPLGEWPQGTFPRRRYHTAAQHAGGRLGSVMNRAKQVPEFLSDRVRNLKHRFRLIRGRAGESDVARSLRGKTSDAADTATRAAKQARNRADYYAHNYPVQFIAAAAATGFFVGFLLRMGREE